MKKWIVTTIVLGILAAAVQGYAEPPGNKPPKGSGGGGKGGFGELGDGCVTFLSSSDEGKVYDDGLGPYCNGTDGQVSVPVRLRLDTQKFNPSARYFWIEGTCNPDAGDTTQALCLDGVEGTRMTLGPDLDGVDWNWTEMGVKAEKPATMGIKIDTSHHLYFDPRPGGYCDPDGLSGADFADRVYVRCDFDTNADGLCDGWTISTDPDFPTVDFDNNASSACFKTGAYGDFYNGDVTANFTVKVCVMGVGCE